MNFINRSTLESEAEMELIQQKIDRQEKGPSENLTLNSLRKNLLAYIFDFLDQNDFFCSVALVNKIFYSICKSFKPNLSVAQLNLFEYSSTINYDQKVFDHILDLRQLKKLIFSRKRLFYLKSLKKLKIFNERSLLCIFAECQWAKTIQILDFGVIGDDTKIVYLLNSLNSLKSLRIYSSKTSKIFLYLLKKFIDSTDLFNLGTEIAEHGMIVYHPLEKFYSNLFYEINQNMLLESISNNNALKVFECFGLSLTEGVFVRNLSKVDTNKSLKKFSIRTMSIELLKELLSVNIGLEHLHFDLNFSKNCDSFGYLIKNHPTLRCLKISSIVNSSDENLLSFFEVLSGSGLKKFEIHYDIIKSFHHSFIKFVNSLPLIQKLYISTSTFSILNHNIIFDCFKLTKVESFNKIKRHRLYPNEFGILKINYIEYDYQCSRIYSILFSKTILEAQNLKSIEYPTHSVNISKLPVYFLPKHKFYCDKIEDFYFINKAKSHDDFKQAHFIYPNFLSNRLNIFKGISNCIKQFSSIRILKIKIKTPFIAYYILQDLIEKLKSFQKMEEFFLCSKEKYIEYQFIDFNLPSLQKFIAKNISFRISSVEYKGNLFHFEGLLYLNLSNSSFAFNSIDRVIDSISFNKSLSSIILTKIEIRNCDNLEQAMLYYESLMKLLREKTNMEELEISLFSNDWLGFNQNKTVLETFSKKYLDFLRVYLRKNPNLKSFDFFLFLTKNLYQQFIQVILNFCIRNQNLMFLFGKKVNQINCFKVTKETPADSNCWMLFTNLNHYALTNENLTKSLTIQSVNFVEFLNEYKISMFKYEFISLNQCTCQEIIFDDYIYDDLEIKQILKETNPITLYIPQSHLQELEKCPTFLKNLWPYPCIQII